MVRILLYSQYSVWFYTHARNPRAIEAARIRRHILRSFFHYSADLFLFVECIFILTPFGQILFKNVKKRGVSHARKISCWTVLRFYKICSVLWWRFQWIASRAVVKQCLSYWRLTEFLSDEKSTRLQRFVDVPRGHQGKFE